jgi:hypothetical protein
MSLREPLVDLTCLLIALGQWGKGRPAAMGAILRLILFVFLTVVTQIGGIAMVVSWLILRRLGQYSHGWRRRAEVVAAFAATYIVLSLLIVPPLAWLGGRVPLSCGFSTEGGYAAADSLYCILNRNYVDKRLSALMEALGKHMQATFPGTTTLYLDGNFPFFNGFPLIPHLSHSDGRKLDLAFYYTDAAGQYIPGLTRSPIGYWAFEQPPAGDPGACGSKSSTLRWNVNWLQPLLPDWKLDVERTRAAVNWLVTTGAQMGVEKLYLEPHVTARLGVGSPLIRFQGCQAARHDDHIHLQIRR